MLNIFVAILVTAFVSIVLAVYYAEWKIERSIKAKLALKEAEIITVVENGMDESYKRGYAAGVRDTKQKFNR